MIKNLDHFLELFQKESFCRNFFYDYNKDSHRNCLSIHKFFSMYRDGNFSRNTRPQFLQKFCSRQILAQFFFEENTFLLLVSNNRKFLLIEEIERRNLPTGLVLVQFLFFLQKLRKREKLATVIPVEISSEIYHGIAADILTWIKLQKFIFFSSRLKKSFKSSSKQYESCKKKFFTDPRRSSLKVFCRDCPRNFCNSFFRHSQINFWRKYSGDSRSVIKNVYDNVSQKLFKRFSQKILQKFLRVPTEF